MSEVIRHDVLILGSGLAGLRAAVEVARASGGKVSVGIISKVQLMRSHSVAAEGGTAAMMRPDQVLAGFVVEALEDDRFSDFNACRNHKEGGDYFESLVDLKGFEPLTSSMPWKRAPNCATGPRRRELHVV